MTKKLEMLDVPDGGHSYFVGYFGEGMRWKRRASVADWNEAVLATEKLLAEVEAATR